MALQVQQMEQQKKLQDAQIAATYAQANKDNAAAEEHEQNVKESVQKVENLIKEGDLTESTNELRKIETEIGRKTSEIKDWEIATEQGLGMKYRGYLKSNGGYAFETATLVHMLDNRLSFGKIKVILEAMRELRLIEISEGMKTSKISVLPVNGRVDLESAPIIKKLREVF